jgi:hypothetical protein
MIPPDPTAGRVRNRTGQRDHLVALTISEAAEIVARARAGNLNGSTILDHLARLIDRTLTHSQPNRTDTE